MWGLWSVTGSNISRPNLMATPQLGFPEHKNLSHTRGSHNFKLEKPKPTQGLITGHHGDKETGLLSTYTLCLRENSGTWKRCTAEDGPSANPCPKTVLVMEVASLGILVTHQLLPQILNRNINDATVLSLPLLSHSVFFSSHRHCCYHLTLLCCEPAPQVQNTWHNTGTTL